ncbi:MAG: metal-dependent transcriptional regulator [Chloroflexota bacterium]
MLSNSTEDYLKAMYELSQEDGRAVTTAIASRLGVSPASVTGMLRKMAAQRPQLVAYQKHRGATLTAEGRRRVLEIIRHHRLIETFLHQTLGLPWDLVHAEAERMEHALSEDLEARIDEHLGFPSADPHGGPIPTRDGTLPPRVESRLCDLPEQTAARVARVPDHNPDFLRYLETLGLIPGAPVTLVRRDPFEGPLHLRVGNLDRSIGLQAARQVYVTPLD